MNLSMPKPKFNVSQHHPNKIILPRWLDINGFVFSLHDDGRITVLTPAHDGMVFDAQESHRLMNWLFVHRDTILDGSKEQMQQQEQTNRKRKSHMV